MTSENPINPIKRVLIVDDEATIRTVLQAQIKRLGHQTTTASNGKEAVQILQSQSFDLIISDLKMPRMNGIELLTQTKILHPKTPFVLLTAHGTINTAVEAMKIGAFDFLSKPFDKEDLKKVLNKAFALERSKLPRLLNSIGNAPKIKEVFDLVLRVAPTSATVLITGESGTGKELIAKSLHQYSPRAERPFVTVNCGAIPHQLFESEFFGHEKGSFTGANQTKIGTFEHAQDGTLFLDEIGELSKDMQVKLLRVLQDGSFTRVGGLEQKHADIRLITATNRNLAQEVSDGNFREDLYYRLNILPIHLPPLRERLEDIPLLVRHFIENAMQKFSKEVSPELSIGDLQILQSYHWPGNIRELENMIERAVLLCQNDTITMKDFLHPELSPTEELGLKDFIRQQTARLEKQHIKLILNSCQGNVTHTAKQLGISRKSLQNKMREYHLRDIS